MLWKAQKKKEWIIDRVKSIFYYYYYLAHAEYIYRAREQTHTFVTLSISIVCFTACFPAAIFLDVQGMFDAVKP